MKLPLRQYWLLLSDYLRPQRWRVALLAGLLFSTIGLQLLNPQVLRSFIDTATSGGSLETLLGVSGLFIGMALVSQLIAVLTTYTSENVGWTATNALRNDLAAHCLRLDMPFHNLHTPGELIERIDGDITALAQFFSQLVLRVLGSLLLMLGVLVVLYLEDWRVGLIMTLFTLAATTLLIKIRGRGVASSEEERESNARLYGFLEERLAGIEDIRANGAKSYVMRRYFETTRHLFLATRKAFMKVSNMWVAFDYLFAIGYIIVFMLGAYLYTNGSITLGTAFLFFQYLEMLRNPLDQLTRQLPQLQKATAGIRRIQELREVQPTIHDGKGPKLPGGALSLEFEGVSFSYDPTERDARLTLKNVSFRLEPGKVLGLLGRTGSGTTTTTRLIFRLYEPTLGTIRVGGQDIQDSRLEDLRHRVGMVTQEVQLFHASVRDNLTLFRHDIEDERILAVIRQLGLADWFDGLPDGLDSELKSEGAGLSAGEAQLLAFARVFLEEPGLVVMDEASSRLDPATEHQIEEAVDTLLRSRTGLIIAHRLATVQRADYIMILEDGRVVEYGSRAELASNPASRFYALLRTGLEESLV